MKNEDFKEIDRRNIYRKLSANVCDFQPVFIDLAQSVAVNVCICHRDVQSMNIYSTFISYCSVKIKQISIL